LSFPPPSVASFWAGGPIPALDKACLLSFALAGHPVVLYSFEKLEGLPDGIETRDAGEIAPRSSLTAFYCQGRPNLQHFSDHFRYRLQARTPHIWIDTDLVSLRPLDFGPIKSLLAKETDRSLCNAIIRIPSDDPTLGDLITRTERLMHKDLVWGATGPRLLTKVMGTAAVFDQAHPPKSFFPIHSHYDEFWKPFLPEYTPECVEATRDAYTLHLWNNIVVQMGVWKELAPPEGSFLWNCLHDRGVLGLFRHTYPADVMRQMVANWRFRKNGADLLMPQLVKQVFPSMARTLRPRIRALIQLRDSARSNGAS
jgi:hypothetical protein